MPEKKRVFKYVPVSKEQKEKRSEFKGYEPKETFLKENIPLFKVREKENRIRIMPPTWEGYKHYGYDIHVHYGVGPKKESFLCPKKMGKSSWCPVCNEVEILKNEGKTELATSLKSKYRLALWLIDRKAINQETKKNEGPKFWAMPWTVDSNIFIQAKNEDTGEIEDIESPDEGKGYDVTFVYVPGEKTAKKFATYEGEKVVRTSTPLSIDYEEMMDWLDFITEHPIPELLVFRTPEYIKDVLDAKIIEGEKPEEVRSTEEEKFEQERKDEIEWENKEESKEEESEKEEVPVDFNYFNDQGDSDLREIILENSDDYSKKELKLMEHKDLVSLICKILDIEIPKVEKESSKSAKEILEEKIRNRNNK